MSEQQRQQPEGETDREQTPQSSGRVIDRRTLLKSGLLAGGALAGGGAALADLVSKADPDPAAAQAATRAKTARHGKAPHHDSKGGAKQPGSPPGYKAPNILVVMVDQLRTPQWFSATPQALASMPNLARLRKGAVSFENHYTAANDCTPARATLLTGLHTHQTGCMIHGGCHFEPRHYSQ